MTLSIFIASMTRSESPAATSWPGGTAMDLTTPGRGALTAASVPLGAGAVVVAGTDSRIGSAVVPSGGIKGVFAPTVKISPSTSARTSL